MDKVVMIRKSVLLDLIEDSLLLGYLEDAGVDNWLGYEESYRDFSANLGRIDEILDEIIEK
jgi:hypothetical protein